MAVDWWVHRAFQISIHSAVICQKCKAKQASKVQRRGRIVAKEKTGREDEQNNSCRNSIPHHDAMFKRHFPLS